MKKLEGKVTLVTGGSSGIGLATAQLFAAEGAYVYITGRRQAELDEAVSLIGDNVTPVQSDVSNLDDLDRLYEVIKRQHNHLDVIFANAGGGEFLSLEAVTEEHFDRTFDTNVKGLLFTVQKALPLFKEGGSIILNSSTAGSSGTEALSVYGATKAAVRSFARSWTSDLKGRKIRVNAVSPGPINTPGLSGLAPDQSQSQQFLDFLATTIPLGRLGQPQEVAKTILFLASDDSSFITGTELFVDGGANQI